MPWHVSEEHLPEKNIKAFFFVVRRNRRGTPWGRIRVSIVNDLLEIWRIIKLLLMKIASELFLKSAHYVNINMKFNLWKQHKLIGLNYETLICLKFLSSIAGVCLLDPNSFSYCNRFYLIRNECVTESDCNKEYVSSCVFWSARVGVQKYLRVFVNVKVCMSEFLFFLRISGNLLNTLWSSFLIVCRTSTK